ncbi:MAG: hypothetical protein NTW61_03030 [Candidatus Melainabacteria bacterium]|nr:hypothetical protein [Candidatus Melainabacteria bacterium]
MSVVSAELGMFRIGRTKHVPIAVQYAKNDTDMPEPADFTQGEQMPCFNLSKRIGIPAVNLVPSHKGEFVPLKCDQQNTRPADTTPFTAQLNIPTDMPPIMRRSVDYGISKFPDITPDIPYNQGIKGTRAIDFSDINEPTGAMFRRGTQERRYAPPTISYDLGIDELRKMTMR